MDCLRCGKPMTNFDALRRGYGDDCYSKLVKERGSLLPKIALVQAVTHAETYISRVYKIFVECKIDTTALNTLVNVWGETARAIPKALLDDNAPLTDVHFEWVRKLNIAFSAIRSCAEAMVTLEIPDSEWRREYLIMQTIESFYAGLGIVQINHTGLQSIVKKYERSYLRALKAQIRKEKQANKKS